LFYNGFADEEVRVAELTKRYVLLTVEMLNRKGTNSVSSLEELIKWTNNPSLDEVEASLLPLCPALHLAVVVGLLVWDRSSETLVYYYNMARGTYSHMLRLLRQGEEIPNPISDPTRDSLIRAKRALRTLGDEYPSVFRTPVGRVARRPRPGSALIR